MNYRKILLLALFAMFQFPGLVQGQEAEEGQTIEALVSAAIANDAILKQLDEKLRAEKTRIGEGFSYPPLQVSYGFFALPIETRNGPQRQKISIKQAFPWPGLASSVEDLPAKKADLVIPEKALRVRKIRYNVEQFAWTLWHHQKEITLTQAHLVLLEGLISSTRSLNVIGRVPKSAVSLATLEKAKIVDRLDREKSNVEVAKKSLVRWTGVDVKKVNVEPQIENFVERETSYENHPKLDVLDGADVLDRAKIAMQEKRDLPKFSIGVDYFEIGENENANSGQDALMAMVGISIPLWSSPSSSEVEALQANIVGRNFLRENTKREILSKAEIEVLKIQDHLRRIRYLKKTIIPLAQVYRTDLTAEFETDRAKIQDVIQALNRVYKLQLELADTQAKFEKSRSKHVFESGTPEATP